MNRQSEAFALAGFMLNVNLIRLLTFKGVITPDEAMATVEESRHQLSALGTINQAARADMLDRDLLDYEALFQEVDEAAAQELMATLADTLWRILDDDARENDEAGAPDIDVDTGTGHWQRAGWGNDQDDMADAIVMEVADYEDGDEEPANQP
jgi:hypothetical protein